MNTDGGTALGREAGVMKRTIREFTLIYANIYGHDVPYRHSIKPKDLPASYRRVRRELRSSCVKIL